MLIGYQHAFEKFDWTKYLINILEHNYQSNKTCAEAIFISYFHRVIIIITRL